MECAVDTTSCDPLAAALAIATLIKSLSNQLIAFLLGCVWSDICGLVSKERNPNQVESLSDQLNYLKRIPHEGKNNRSHHAPPRPVVSLRQSQPDCRAASSWGKHRRSHDVNRVSSRGRFKQRQNPWLASISTEQNFRAIHRCNDLFVGAKWIQPKCKRDAKNPCPAIAAPQSHSPAGYAGSLWLAQSDQCAEDAFALISNISGLFASFSYYRPFNVWSKFFTRNFAVRSKLNVRASLGGDLSFVFPLPNSAFRYTKLPCKSGTRTKYF